MGDAVGRDNAGAFQAELVVLKVGEQPDAVAEEDRDEANVDLVEQAGLELLLGDVGSADCNGPLAGDRAGALERALDTVGDDRPLPGPTCWSGGLCVSRKQGAPTGWWPPRPPAMSKVRLPVMIAPQSNISFTTGRLRAGGS